jgi:hypothetical protein
MAVNLGSTAIGNMYIGNTQVQNVYLGNSLIYSAGNPIQTIINNFKIRVANDGGTFEAESNLLSILNSVNSSIGLSKVNMLLTPNAFKASKAYNVIGPTDFVMLRNTDATRVNASGLVELQGSNIMRIDYTSGTPMILDEAQSTNLIVDSKDYTQSSWFKDNLLIAANAVVSPDGVNNSLKIVENTSTVQHRMNVITGLPANTLSSYSFWGKATERRYVYIRSNIASNPATNFNLIGYDLQTNTFNVIKTGVTATARAYANGWYKISISFTTLNSSPLIYTGLSNTPVTSDVNPSYQGVVNNGANIWNVQHELGAASSDIFTAGSAVTRNEDVLTVTPPASTIRITTTFLDNTTQVLNTIPATFTLPSGQIRQVVFQNSL